MAGNTQKKPSRVLAALGSSALHFDSPQRSQTPLNALKRKGTPNYESPAESSAKKRASSSQLGVGINRAEAEGEQCLEYLSGRVS
jgi:hypothetical protein